MRRPKMTIAPKKKVMYFFRFITKKKVFYLLHFITKFYNNSVYYSSVNTLVDMPRLLMCSRSQTTEVSAGANFLVLVLGPVLYGWQQMVAPVLSQLSQVSIQIILREFRVYILTGVQHGTQPNLCQVFTCSTLQIVLQQSVGSY